MLFRSVSQSRYKQEKASNSLTEEEKAEIAKEEADLFIKAQTLVNLQTQGALTEKQIQTEIQRAILVSAEASGKKVGNRVASETADSLIKAANASQELQYRDSTYDYKNVKLRKHTEYKTSMAHQKAAEYGAELARKQARTHYWESVSRGLGSIACLS